MDIFWIFIIIFGVIVSIGQKANKQQPTPDDSEPTLSPEQEMERHIRELLEGKSTPAPKSAPNNIPHAASIRREERNTPISPKSAQNAVIPHKKRATSKTSPTKDNISPIKEKEIKRSEIGQIVDDFTIDKAVIYAEIMKPKYEEY